MSTFVAVHSAPERARLELRAGALVPREIERTATTARVALVAGGALLLGGDRVHLDIVVGHDCVLEIEDIGGTVAYDADGEDSGWSTTVTVEAGGTLSWSSWPFVISSGAAVQRSLRVDLAPGARACIRETIVLGRTGEVGGTARIRTDASLGERPLFVEELLVDGARSVPGVLGGNRVLDTILFLGDRPATTEAPSNVFELESPGAVARSLGTQTHRANLDELWKSWHEELLRPSNVGISR